MSPDHRIIWSPESEQDLLDIWHWGAGQFSPEIADKHLRDIHQSTLLLTGSPFAGRSRDELRQGLRSLVIYPSVLIYRVHQGKVQIVRVVDGRRDLVALFSSEN